MMNDLEQIIDEITTRLKKGRDISFWKNDSRIAPVVNILSKLSEFPKAKIPAANFMRVKNQVLDRIAVPADAEATKIRAGFFASIPSMLKLASGIAGTLLIILSLAVGTAAAALQSVPGQPIYPLKRVVENLELAFTRDPAARASLQIKFANNRLEELSAVIEKNKSGEISNAEAQKIVSQTVNDIQKNTAAALNSTKSTDSSKQASALNKLVDLSDKQAQVLAPLLSAANIRNDGQAKIVLEQALQTSQISKEEAIKNMENAGLKIDEPAVMPNQPEANAVNANGKITALTPESISIGTAKFLVTKDTKYDNIESADLEVGTAVQINGEVRDDKKTYALTVSPAPDQTTDSIDTTTDTKGTTTDTQAQQ